MAVGYQFTSATAEHTHAYVWPALFAQLDRLELTAPNRRVFDLGCGNGATAKALSNRGWLVQGVDPSESGIAQARAAHPTLDLRIGSSDDDLPATFGTFPAVISLEVVEHVYLPRRYARSLFDLLEPGGTAFVSTPYHGYWKNLALALTGRMDAHFTALWDYGHIKFWSVKTLTALLVEAGFEVEQVLRVGRIQPLAKSMLAVARRPNVRR
jgi:2-polyprenyl-6-hydroxyphenyl methylase/3-demethylubiquinone-9 3-methyltransferase